MSIINYNRPLHILLENSKKGSIRCIESVIGRRLRCYCRTCKKPFLCKFKEFIRGGGLYCSVICYRNTPKPAKRPRPRSWLNRCCRGCGKEFKVMVCVVKKGGGVYCTRKCAFKYFRPKNNTIEISCKYCKKIFEEWLGAKKKQMYCSLDCRVKDMLIGDNNPFYGKQLPEDHRKKISETRIERKIGCWNKGKKCPQITEALKGEKSCWFGKRGPQAANWKGADRPLYHFIRGSPEYVAWRKAVFERDYYKCKICDKKGNINCHHIKPFRQILKDNDIKTLDQAKTCKELFDINNGVTLCEPCHADMDEYFHRFKKHL